MKQLFSDDPVTGIREFFHYDPVTDQAVIETVQDYTALAEANQAQRNEVTSLDRWGDGKRVASFPMAIYADMKKKGILNDQAAMRRWLNDPDNRVFRTRPGKV